MSLVYGYGVITGIVIVLTFYAFVFLRDLIDQENRRRKGETGELLIPPAVGSRWIHKNGQPYTVIAVANQPYTSLHPLTVVIENEINGSTWTWRASHWRGFFVPIPPYIAAAPIAVRS